MDAVATSERVNLFRKFVLATCLATGCATDDRSVASRIEPVHTNLEQLSSEPEKFSGRVITLSAYARPFFEGTSLERLQLWSKNSEGNCTTLNGRRYSVSREDIRNRSIAKSSEHHASQIEITGKFHYKELMINPGLIEFYWHGYLTEASLKLGNDSCIIQ